jgi:tRNA threonylcarbamoyladenosine biosynthesis protein TsaE
MKDAKEVYSLTLEELPGLAVKVVSELSSRSRDRAATILLEGDLGAGKTTFTQMVAEVLGVKDSVHSPTFILKKEYRTPHTLFRKLVHIDAYRFTHPKEAKVLRLEEDLSDPQALVIVEWPSKMSYLEADLIMTLEVTDEHSRKITLAYEK